MEEEQGGEITQLLRATSQGNAGAAEELLERVYDSLLRIARRKISRPEAEISLAPPDLVSEAYLRLFHRSHEKRWDDRDHFFNAAAQVMSSVRKDWLRSRYRLKRGAGDRPVQLDEDLARTFSSQPRMALQLSEALETLERTHGRRKRAVAECRLAGMTVGETAEALRTASTTVDRDWRLARAALRRHLG